MKVSIILSRSVGCKNWSWGCSIACTNAFLIFFRSWGLCLILSCLDSNALEPKLPSLLCGLTPAAVILCTVNLSLLRRTLLVSIFASFTFYWKSIWSFVTATESKDVFLFFNLLIRGEECCTKKAFGWAGHLCWRCASWWVHSAGSHSVQGPFWWQVGGAWT